ncbi:MAG: CinA family protein [Parachlamydiaceae bacterium]
MLENQIQRVFVPNGWTLSVAESCTGGAIASRLTKVAGASGYFVGGVISYSNEMKEKLLHVSPVTLKTYGAVSQEVVTQMVLGIIQLSNSNFGIAVTGVAGPSGGSPEKPVGTVWIAVARKGAKPTVHKLTLDGDRASIIEQSSIAALQFLLNLFDIPQSSSP